MAGRDALGRGCRRWCRRRSPGDCEWHLLQALEPYSEDELRSWLRHGHGPEKQTGEMLAQEVPRLPDRTLASVLADLLQRPRLAGAEPFVAQMVSALTLPPRK